VIKQSKIYVDGLSAPKSNKEREARGLAGARSLGTRILSPGSAWPPKAWRGICLKKIVLNANCLNPLHEGTFF
jgi:hypothetical protein